MNLIVTLKEYRGRKRLLSTEFEEIIPASHVIEEFAAEQYIGGNSLAFIIIRLSR